MVKVQTLKGFRDFLPKEAKKRQYVINTLKQVFESYGFEPLETPALEYEEVLLGKYGEEGDKLMYRFTDKGGRKVALRYDQTVPLARVVAQYGNELPIPFKRYQIQPVWRGENPQKGRFREFLQCDADIIGLSSPLADAEIIAVVYDCLNKLKLKAVIKINDRVLLKGIDPKYLTAIDKLNKIGKQGVLKELEEKGLEKIDAEEIFRKVSAMVPTDYIVSIMQQYQKMRYPLDSLKYDPSLIRGLDYYTGLIFEVEINGYTAGSVCGGGRYDNLIGVFAGKDIPAVGFAFGFDRLMEAMNQLNLFPQDLLTTKVLVTIFSPDLKEKSLDRSLLLRSNGVSTEVFLDENTSLEKQLKYADQKGIPYCIIIGPDEAKNGTVIVKNMKTGEQKTISGEKLVGQLMLCPT